MKLGTLVGVHGDRAVAVVRIWRGFARLECRSSQKGEAVDGDCCMVVFQLALIGPCPIGSVTDHMKRIAFLDVLLDHVGRLLLVHDQVVPGHTVTLRRMEEMAVAVEYQLA
jgi:hypothetical protein